MKRKLIKIGLSLILIFCIALSAVWLMYQKPMIAEVERQVQSATGLKLSIGSIRPAVFGLSLNKLSLKAQNESQLSLNLDQAKFKLKLLPLLTKKVVFSKIIFDAPKLRYDLSYIDQSASAEASQEENIEEQSFFESIELKQFIVNNMEVDLFENTKPLFSTNVPKQVYTLKTKGLDVFDVRGNLDIKQLIYHSTYGDLGRGLQPKINFNISYDTKQQKAKFNEANIQDDSIEASMTADLDLSEKQFFDVALNAKSEHLKKIVALLPSKLFDDQGIKSSDGKLKLDMFYKGSSNYKTADYQVQFKLSDGEVKYAQDIKDINIDLDIDSKNIALKALKAKTAKSFVDLKGGIKNYLLSANMQSSFAGQYALDFNELNQINIYPKGHEVLGSVKGSFKAIHQGSQNSLTGKHQFKDVSYSSKENGLKLKSLNGDVNLVKDGLAFNFQNFYLNDDSLSVKGSVNRLDQYLYQNKALAYDFLVEAKSLNLDQWLSSDESEQTQSNQEQTDFEALKKFNGQSQLVCKNLKYNDVDLKNINALLVTRKGKVNLKKLDADVFSGALKSNFEIDLSQKKSFPYSANLDLNKVQIQKFLDFGKAFLPMRLGKTTQLGGLLSSQIKTSGSIDAVSFMPNINSVSFEGPVDIIDGYLRGSKIQSGLASFIKKDTVKSMDFKSWSQYLKFNKGTFELSKLAFSGNGVGLKGNGTQSLAGDLDYKLNLDLLKKDAEKILPKALSGQSQNATVSVPLAISGTLSDMKIKLDEKSIQKSATKTIEKEVEKELKKQGVDEVKKKAKNVLKGLGF